MRTLAFPRYILDTEGDRIRGQMRYKKIYALEERLNHVKIRYPQFFIFDPIFNEHLCEVDDACIAEHYDPRRRLFDLRKGRALNSLQSQSLRFIEELRTHSKTSWEDFGLSGSILVNLSTPTSDIDVMVYGNKTSHLVSAAVKDLQKDKGTKVAPYTKQDLYGLYERRVEDTPMPFDIFLWHEARKSHQGRFEGREFFIRFINDWGRVLESYGDTIYKPMGYAKVRVVVTGDEESIFTPCLYDVKQIEFLAGRDGLNIEQVSSFRGRFCEQAEVGEEVEVQGKAETLETKDRKYQRLLVGSTGGDYMVKCPPSMNKTGAGSSR